MLDEVVDSGDEVFDAPETAFANRLLGDEAEPTFDLIEPGRVGRSVVDLEAGPLRQPESYLGVFVGGIVVDDQMDIKASRYGLIDAFEKLKKFLMTVACLALRQDGAGGDVESGKQGGGAMANVVVGHSFDVSKSHGQHGLGLALRRPQHQLRPGHQSVRQTTGRREATQLSLFLRTQFQGRLRSTSHRTRG